MNNIDSRIAQSTLALDAVIVENEWSLDEWRGLLAHAKELDHQLDVEAEEAGRR